MTRERTKEQAAPRITARQHAVLHVVQEHGPITAREVDRHGFTASEGAARASLSRLETRGLVDADYTAHGGRGRGYTITSKGASALAAFDAD
jgi:DNA-binding PadR family transcriptional regulator